MHEHRCGPNCSTARFLARLARTRHRLDTPRVIPVKTWCRICGVPALLEVVADYDMAVRYFYALDDTPMVHKGVHAEQGGWGVNWRLDDVLFVVFPKEHIDEIWPIAPWWREQHREPMSEDQGVLVLTQEDLNEYQDTYMDMELRLLERYLNRNPRNREQLGLDYEEVWDTKEVSREFQILGFKSPFAIAKCMKTGLRGSLIFQNTPRFYFGWDSDRVI